MARYARLERQALADSLLAVGSGAPTMCAGWLARDLAAHVVLRDRRPDAAVGIVLAPLAWWTARVQRGLRDRYSFPDLVAQVRRAPWWSPAALSPIDDVANTVEFFVHTEDVRRAQPDWRLRSLPPDLEGALWRRVPMLARFRLRRFPAPVMIHAPGHGELVVGTGRPLVVLGGAPGELLLFLFGRQPAAKVTVNGPAHLVSQLRSPAR